MIFNMTGGGGLQLNFNVIGSTTQPSNPTENTIWVNTSVEITGCRFQSEQPSGMQQGEVWFSVGTGAAVPFNALKKGYIYVYPLNAKQYVNGSLNSVSATTYQNGKWTSWIYTIQNLTSSFWKANGTTSRATVTNEGGGLKITFTSVAKWDEVGGYVNELVNLKHYKTVVFSGIHSGVAETLRLCIYNKSGSVLSSVQLPVGSETKPTSTNLESYPIDCAGINDECYIGISAKVGTFAGSLTITSIKIK